MPIPREHRLLWNDLLKDHPGSSWTEIVTFLFNKDHAFSNYKKCKKRDHLEVRKELFQDDKIKQYIAADGDNQVKVEKILDEMCHLLSIQCNPTRKLKYAGAPFMKCISKIYSNIYVSNHLLPMPSNGETPSNLFREQYLRMSRELPIVILPTHRSYMDFLFITYILFVNELPLPIVATGDNFKAMGKFLTDFLKGTGAFLVRRNAHNKKDIEANVYYDILRAYVHSILTGGENPLEFFMEGTRTRSGQVLRPKTGLLSMISDMYLGNLVEDAWILPVSISYQRPIEEQLYVGENTPQIGLRKPKESAKNLVKAIETIVKRNYGQVYVRFVEPFKLSAYFQQWKEATKPDASNDEANATLLHDFTNSLATKVCLEQAYNNVLMPFSLISYSAVFRSFLKDPSEKPKQNGSSDSFPGKASLSFQVVVRDFQALEELLKNTQPQFIPGWKSHLEILDDFKLDRDGIIRSSADRRYLEFNLDALTFHTMLYYSNQLTQIILPIAICLILINEDLKDTRWKNYKSIRYLLSREFLVDSLSMEKEFEQSIGAIENKLISDESKLMIVGHLVYFIRSYLVFLYYLNENKVLNKLKFFEHQDKQIRHSEGQRLFISKDMLKNMIDLLKELDICESVNKDNQQHLTTTRRTNPFDEEVEVKNSEKLAELIQRFEHVLSMSKGIV